MSQKENFIKDPHQYASANMQFMMQHKKNQMRNFASTPRNISAYLNYLKCIQCRGHKSSESCDFFWRKNEKCRGNLKSRMASKLKVAGIKSRDDRNDINFRMNYFLKILWILGEFVKINLRQVPQNCVCGYQSTRKLRYLLKLIPTST